MRPNLRLVITPAKNRRPTPHILEDHGLIVALHNVMCISQCTHQVWKGGVAQSGDDETRSWKACLTVVKTLPLSFHEIFSPRHLQLKKSFHERHLQLGLIKGRAPPSLPHWHLLQSSTVSIIVVVKTSSQKLGKCGSWVSFVAK